MEIPADILEKLRCDNCEEYLSCAPVFLTDKSKSLCGRCTEDDEEDMMRNSPYEEVAQLLKFPCMNQVHGCTQLVSFAECKSHEDGCEYQRYQCPVAPFGRCDWIGNRNGLLEHCRQHHSDSVVSNPVELTHDITKPSRRTFIMSALNVLFILHAKVCLDTKTIYHSVRFLGDPSRASSYMYSLLVMNEDSEYRKRKDVEPQAWLTLEHREGLATNINYLLGMIGELRGTTFTITVHSKCAQCNFTVESKQSEAKESLCRSCTIDQRPCKYKDKGCMYVDMDRKSFKHERFFCQYSNWCEFCSKCITSNLDKHYKTFHTSARCSSSLLWTDFISTFWKLRIIETDFGYALCHYSLNIGNIIISVRSSLSSDQLQNYTCQIELTHPTTEYTVKRQLEAQYSDVNDWFTIIYVKDLQISEDNKFKIKIDLIKITN